MKSRFLAAAALAAAITPAQICPHTTVQPVGPVVTPIASVPCGTGITINVGAVQISVRDGECPASVLVAPVRDLPLHQPGCGTEAVQQGTVAMLQMTFVCEPTKIVFIPIGSACVSGQQSVIGQLATYVAKTCLAAAATTTTATS